MKKRDYELLSDSNGSGSKSRHEMKKELKKWGRKGWRLLSTENTNGTVQYCMERKLKKRKKKKKKSS